ncbi:serine/threonine protein kinase [Lysobacter enzymogenes]|nr:serine/threonine-protein kinase [Lysobacter enzymogenes]QCW24762.1 serine/threonine protein kinase [Lysobacter enzymogenes]
MPERSGMSLRDRLLQPQGPLRGALFDELLRTRFGACELQPGDRIGAWRIVRELGRGGMGLVCLAERDDGEFDQRVALKLLPDAATAPDSEALFRRERQFLAGLSHPNIARLVDGGHTDDGHLWFAMEYVEGLPVDRHACAHALDERARVTLLLPALEAVEFAHARLLIHRDIKPGNVLVDARGQARLLDFGIAGLAQDSDPAAAFTPDFASPEQRGRRAVGTASDVWQLGRLLDAVLRAGDAAPPSRDLQAIVATAMRERPERRYPTVVALKNELLRYLQRRPVRARGGGPAYRLRRLAQRHPYGTAGTALSALALLALAAAFALQSAAEQRRLLQARDETAAINRFLSEDILGASDPFEGDGDKRPIAAQLEDGVQRAQARFRGHPAVAGRVVLALGKSLLARGRYDAAEDAAERAAALLASDADAHSAADAQLLRATVDMYRGRPLRAQRRLERLQASFPYRAGADSPLEWHIQVARGWNAMLRSRFGECVAIYTALLAHPGAIGEGDLGDAYNSLSLCQVAVGAATQGLRSGERAERLAAAANGPRSGNAAIARIRIAVALSALGRHHEATARFRDEVDALIGLLGENHGTTATYMDHLGLLYLCAGDNEAAVEWTGRGLRARQRVFGPQHPWTIGVQAQYAVALLRSGRIDAARGIVAEVERMQDAVDEPGSQVAMHRGLGEWYLREGRIDASIRHYRAARELASRPGMQYRWNLHAIDAGLGLAASRAGRSAQARQAYLRYDQSGIYDNRCDGGLRAEADADRLSYPRRD